MSGDACDSYSSDVQEDPRYSLRGDGDQNPAPFVKGRRKTDKKSAFSVNSNVKVELDFDMALALGRFIIDSRSENTAIMALGHQLTNLGEEPD
tara:strand:- start:76 stop:354 length:279 start_codon:yes stop_codon:yes gene_type:complete